MLPRTCLALILFAPASGIVAGATHDDPTLEVFRFEVPMDYVDDLAISAAVTTSTQTTCDFQLEAVGVAPASPVTLFVFRENGFSGSYGSSGHQDWDNVHALGERVGFDDEIGDQPYGGRVSSGSTDSVGTLRYHAGAIGVQGPHWQPGAPPATFTITCDKAVDAVSFEVGNELDILVPGRDFGGGAGASFNEQTLSPVNVGVNVADTATRHYDSGTVRLIPRLDPYGSTYLTVRGHNGQSYSCTPVACEEGILGAGTYILGLHHVGASAWDQEAFIIALGTESAP